MSVCLYHPLPPLARLDQVTILPARMFIMHYSLYVVCVCVCVCADTAVPADLASERTPPHSPLRKLSLPIMPSGEPVFLIHRGSPLHAIVRNMTFDLPERKPILQQWYDQYCSLVPSMQ